MRRSITNHLLGVMSTPEATIALGRPFYSLAGRRTAKEIPLEGARAILVVRLDEIGDAVLAAPMLRELRRNAPTAWITLVVKPQVFNLVELCPYVNEVHTFEWGATGRAQTLKRPARALYFAATRFWHRRFDLAIIPRWGVDYYHATHLAYLSGARRRVAYSEGISDRKQRINTGLDRMLTDVLTDKSAKHEVEHNLDVIRLLGGEVTDTSLEIWLDQQDRSFAERVLAERGITPGDPVVALAPGAGYRTKQWPIERFAEAGRLFLDEYCPCLVVVGGADARLLGKCLETEMGARVINLAGGTTLRQTAAILERCCLTVSNDSGPMHLAAAAGGAVVEIAWHARGSSPADPDSPARFHPWGVPHAVVQPEHAAAPCRGSCESSQPHCILSVDTAKVWAAARSFLDAGATIGKATRDRQRVNQNPPLVAA